MKKLIATILLLFTILIFAQTPKNYKGLLGKDKEIVMHVFKDSDKVLGWYFYQTIGYNISLQGTQTGNHFQITEYIATTPKGTFDLNIQRDGSLKGFYTSVDSKRYPVILEPMTKEIVEIPENLEGRYIYKNPSEDKCVLELNITKKNLEYFYNFKINGKPNTGKLYIYRDSDEQNIYLNFSKLKVYTTDYINDKEKENWYVEALFDGDKIVIQNYGNAMNPYLVIPDCTKKYLYLKRLK